MENKKTENVGFFDSLGFMIRDEIEKRRKNSGALLFDAVVFIVSFLFAGCHVVFGAYPLGVAFVAVLPRGVWIALIGVVAGSLSLGRAGIIHAIISIIVVFLRIIISGGDRKGEKVLFSEPLILRISCAAIGAFVGAAYEILLGNFAFKSIIYGAMAVILSAIFTFAFAGIFDGEISFSDFLSGRQGIFLRKRNEKNKFSIYLFQATFLLFVFLVSISLKKYNILGISPAYMFSVLITLIVARRFGAVRAMTVGFVSSLAISSVYTVAFALVGLGAGVLFVTGLPYALVGGGVLLSLWSIYSGGTIGFLSVFPEYVTAALLAVPILRKLTAEEKITDMTELNSREAADMVATTALAYRSADGAGLEGISDVLSGLCTPLRVLGEGEGAVEIEEYHDLVINCVKGFCNRCRFYNECISESPAPCVENIDLIAMKLYKRERLFGDDPSIAPKYCRSASELFDEILKVAAELEEQRCKNRKMEVIADEYELFARLISESRLYNEKEKYYNTTLSEKLTPVFERCGLYNGVIKVFGERKKHFIAAGEDKDGKLITSPELHRGIEETAQVRLGSVEYYRKGDIALLECDAAPMYSVEFAAAGKCCGAESISGDTAVSFESADGRFYALISDGMGSGELAHKTSVFVADFLSRILNTCCSKSTALHLLNQIIRNKSEECSATIDLFEFDLITGEATFFKCGAAASYVKREGSIFRLRSETAPLGLMKNIDAERIRVEVKCGDYIVMISDGVSQSPEDATWLLEFLNREVPADMREYAEQILAAAQKNSKSGDDMSVAVARVIAA